MVIKSRVQIFIDSELLKAIAGIGLSAKECLEFGINFKLAERDLIDYPYNKLSNKIIRLQEIIDETISTNEKTNKTNKESLEKEIEKEIKDVFG